MIKHIVALLWLAQLTSGCKVSKSSDGTVASTGTESYVGIGEFLEPDKGAWTGRLILPTERKPDGGVWFEVYSAPKGTTAPSGKIWLTFDKSDAWVNEYLNRTVKGINFSVAAERVAKARAAGIILPERLNGWANVSPLETLAGSRPTHHAELVNGTKTFDSVEVLVRNSFLKDGVLHTRSEPVQIVGRQVALVKFLGPAGDGKYKVKHYKAANSADEFAGQDESVKLVPTTQSGGGKPAMTSFSGIESSMLNGKGWYIFGERVGNIFHVRALEPRQLMSISPANLVADGEDYIRKKNFQNEKERKGTGSTAVVSSSGKKSLSIGDRGLVMHVFGGMGGKGGDQMPVLPISKRMLNTGHFAFGIGKVQKDPFTGQGKLDIEYKQVYAHNNNGIISGSSKWHNYSGSLERGWMYNRPISDVFFHHPAISYPFRLANGSVFDPLDSLSRELEVMMARFRTGDGSGIAEVTATNSCVQDSNQALFIAVMKALDWIKSKEMPASANSTDKQRIERLEGIMDGYRKGIVKLAGFRDDWREALKAKDISINKQFPGGLEALWRAIETGKLLVPRWAYDDIAVLLYKHGSTAWFVRTSQVGGTNPDIYPLAPGFDK